MKAVMVMFDSLNRHLLPPYGCDWTHAQNFQRLAERTVVFDNCYVGSMPCMPARRELHTGRYNFLHRSWGSIEPFDDSMPELLKQHGVYTHLVSDHYHYWEDGGATYHNRYNSWEISRGQEGDPWIGQVTEPEVPASINANPVPHARQDWVNRQFIQQDSQFPQAVTFQMGMDFIRRNHAADNWFLQIETFDPHEPFYVPQRFKDLYPHDYEGPLFDWPKYARVTETPEQARHLLLTYAALLSMCDEHLGKILDLMDELDLWKDTLLIVNTDHGFLLGEHDWWAKCVQPFYGEVAHTPLFLWDPRGMKRGERRSALVQTIDLAPTLLEFFGVPIPADMQGKALRQTVLDDSPVRAAGLFGLHGGHVNVTDGRFVYMRAGASPNNEPLYEYTLMPTHMRTPFSPGELQHIDLAAPFSFTKGCSLMQIRSRAWTNSHPYGNLLFDLEIDPRQEHPLEDAALEERMIRLLIRAMKESDAPPEQYVRLGLESYL